MELKPEHLTVVIDTREKTPLVFTKLKTQPGTLRTGDYSILGLEKKICVERKSLSDLMMCIGRERERFDEELHRMLAYEARCIVVEGTRAAAIAGTSRTKLHPNAIEGSLIGWEGKIHIEFAETPTQAARYVGWFLWLHAKRRWHELNSFRRGMNAVT